MRDLKRVSVSEEVKVMWQEAVEEFNALKVQVLIDNDNLPEGAENVVDLDRLEEVLRNAPVPTRVYVDGRVYKVKLRKGMKREKYREFLEELQKLGKAWWDKKERVIKVMRYEPPEDRGETPEVTVIMAGKGEVGTMQGGGVE